MNLESSDLERALNDCRQAALQGYEIARNNLNELRQDFRDVTDSLTSIKNSNFTKNIRSSEVHSNLKEQMAKVVGELEGVLKIADSDLEKRLQKLDSFSISLFGRTMAGKSTLMEILTQGDGRSIGQGAQRTTLDVRTYSWNGLNITDMPGVAAVGGAEDTELAFATAAHADLIIFLITDDAPQEAEAECLAKVFALGRPVLGVCNLKQDVSDKLGRRRVEQRFTSSAVESILQQFQDFVGRHIPGKTIPFVVTHLRSRFLANQKDYEYLREELIKISRFDKVEAHIVSEVVARGPFWRRKNFIDSASASMSQLIDSLLDYSDKNILAFRTLADMKNQANNWSDTFRTRGETRIKNFVRTATESLRNDIPAFSERYYDASNVSLHWDSLVKSYEFDTKAKNLQNELAEECKTRLSELVRELESQLELVDFFSEHHHIPTDRIFDFKRLWNWGSTIVTSGLTIAAIALGSITFGWAAAAVGILTSIFSFFFESRESKIRKAREKLSRKLNDKVNDIEKKLSKELLEWFKKELVTKLIDATHHNIDDLTECVSRLAYAQKNLAWKLNARKRRLDSGLIDKALELLGATCLKEAVVNIARKPGVATMLLVKDDLPISPQVVAYLEDLLDEKIYTVVDTVSTISILEQALNVEPDRIEVDEPKKTARINFIGELDTEAQIRVKLAQQLIEYHITR